MNESWELMNIHYTSLSLDCIFSKCNISGGYSVDIQLVANIALNKGNVVEGQIP